MVLRNDIKKVIEEELVTCATREGAVFADDTSLYVASDVVVGMIRRRLLSPDTVAKVEEAARQGPLPVHDTLAIAFDAITGWERQYDTND